MNIDVNSAKPAIKLHHMNANIYFSFEVLR